MTVDTERLTKLGAETGGAVKEKRIFVYGEHRLPDPGAQYTNEDVRQYLAGGTFPELANCRIDVKPMKDGLQAVHFVKQATTKGRIETETGEGFSVSALLSLSDGLVDVIEWNEVAGVLGDVPTPAVVCAEEHDDVVTAYIEQVSRFDGGTQRWSQRCLDVNSIPSSFIPLGW